MNVFLQTEYLYFCCSMPLEFRRYQNQRYHLLVAKYICSHGVDHAKVCIFKLQQDVTLE